ncbi:hypothetical protein [Vreelandella nigrificans]|uniref:Uncharacterized protein n=1 Tax=Vreelandella nigrificans TaxID=2042704 RepID=A0A2A4HH85_9GAMM|nr:hypothetical protein [Halomonas nigrificans]PCF93555.1 hypothetical protein CPA45_21845 [Halomonas nigrificans]
MRLTPWLLSMLLGSLLLTAGPAFAERAEPNEARHEALDDAALEEKYGIKAGALQRKEPVASDAGIPRNADSGGEDDAEGGTGGTGSADDAVENGEDEQSEQDSE